jgi:hypothetical protein
MLREEIVSGALQLRSALAEGGILKVLRISAGAAKAETDVKVKNELVLKAFQQFTITSANFSGAASKIQDIMGLSALNSPAFWSALTTPERSREAHEALFSVEFAITHLPKIVELLSQDSMTQEIFLFHGQDLASGRLKLILPESTGAASRPQRIVDALLSISLLYEAFADIDKLPISTLSVIACDAGSDKSFDFLGVADLMKAVKELLLSVWDRVVFFREQQVAHRLELIASSLPIIEKLGDLQRENKIGPEEGELIRRKIVEGVTKFIGSGSTIPGMRERSALDPRVLMAPEPKLLNSSSDPAKNFLNQEEPFDSRGDRDFLDRHQEGNPDTD